MEPVQQRARLEALHDGKELCHVRDTKEGRENGAWNGANGEPTAALCLT